MGGLGAMLNERCNARRSVLLCFGRFAVCRPDSPTAVTVLRRYIGLILTLLYGLLLKQFTHLLSAYSSV